MDALGLCDAGQFVRRVAIGGHARERPRRVADDLEVGRREIESRWDARDLLEHQDELLRVFVRKRRQQNAVDDTEHGRVGADADRQRGYGDSRESGIAAEISQPVPDILAQQIHMFPGRRRHDAVHRVPPQPNQSHWSSASQCVDPMIVKGLRHVVAEIAAEFRGEQAQQSAEDAIGSRHVMDADLKVRTTTASCGRSRRAALQACSFSRCNL